MDTSSAVVLTGWARLLVDPGGPITPARWAGPPARLGRMDRLCGLALVAADGALATAGLTPTDAAAWDGDRTAIVVGTAYGCHATNEEYYRGVVAGGPANASPRAFAYTLPSSPAGEISIHHGARGPSETLASGLGAGLEALALGAALVAGGRAARAMVVAVDVATPLLAKIVRSSGIPSLADAAAAFVLERADDAAARGATPRAQLVASASRGGPASRALPGAVEAALAEAELEPGALRTILATPPDAAALRALASNAGARSAPVAALSAAVPTTLAEWLDDDERTVPMLAVATDPDGGATAIVVSA
jgi:3-oxoacyl-[acyl-carrier-protein] synthase II